MPVTYSRSGDGSGVGDDQPEDPAHARDIQWFIIALLALGVGGMMANGAQRRTFAICQGLGLIVMLVSGFGLLAKLHLGFPHFAMAKTVLWVVIGFLPVILRRLKTPLVVAIAISLTLVTILAWLGETKPALW